MTSRSVAIALAYDKGTATLWGCRWTYCSHQPLVTVVAIPLLLTICCTRAITCLHFPMFCVHHELNQCHPWRVVLMTCPLWSALKVEAALAACASLNLNCHKILALSAWHINRGTYHPAPISQQHCPPGVNARPNIDHVMQYIHARDLTTTRHIHGQYFRPC